MFHYTPKIHEPPNPTQLTAMQRPLQDVMEASRGSAFSHQCHTTTLTVHHNRPCTTVNDSAPEHAITAPAQPVGSCGQTSQ